MKFTITFKKNLVKSFLNRRNRIFNIENNLVWSCLLAETGVACEMEGGRQTNWYVSPKLIFHPVYLLFRICHPTTKQTVTSYNHSHIFTWNKIVTKITAVLARYMSDVSSWTHKLKSRMYIYVQYKDVLKLHNSMIGGANTTRQTLSDATATYDLTGTYLVNEKEG